MPQKVAVDEDQRQAVLEVGPAAVLQRRHTVRSVVLATCPERSPRDGCHAGVFPLLMLRGGESELREAVHGRPPERTEPSGVACRPLLLQRREVREVNVLLLVGYGHQAPGHRGGQRSGVTPPSALLILNKFFGSFLQF